MNQLVKNYLVFGILTSAFFTPFGFCMIGLPMILQMKGFDASVIGIFQLLGIPTVLKFLLSSPIDKKVFKHNHYKKWIIYTGILYIITLLGISFLSLEENIYFVFGAIFMMVLIATFIDIPLNALAIKIFGGNERVGAGSYKMSALFFAGLLGGGILLLTYNHIGWQNTFLIIASIVSLGLFTLFFIKENDETIKTQNISWKTFITFFKQKDIGIWLFLLTFYYAFIGAIWVFMKPYLISKGIAPDDVAFYVGIYGSIVGFIAGIISGSIGKRYSKKTILISFGIFNILSAFIFVCIEYFDVLNFVFLISAITITVIALAFSPAIVYALMMDYSRRTSKAIDYSIQVSLFSFTRIISAVIAGAIVSAYGFGAMFVFETLGMILVLFIIYKFYKE